MSELKLEHAEALKEIVNKAFKAEIHFEGRSRVNVDARRVFCSILSNESNSSTSIGAFLNKDHATVLYAVRSIKGLLASDSSFSERYDDCLKLYDLEKNRIQGIEIDTAETTFLKETIRMLKEDIFNLNVKNKDLQLDIKNIKKDINKWDYRRKDIYDIIDLRTKRGTEDLIEKKINILFNGVYSEEIICF